MLIKTQLLSLSIHAASDNISYVNRIDTYSSVSAGNFSIEMNPLKDSLIFN